MLALIPFVLVVFGLAYIVINQEPPLSTRIVRRQEVSGRRLAYRVVRTERGQLTGIVNEERFAWNDVRVEVGSGSQSFLCDTPRTVDSRDILSLESLMCRAADGSVLSRLCVVAFKREVALACQREEGRDFRICKPSVRCRRVLRLRAPDIESGSTQVDGDHGLSERALKPRVQRAHVSVASTCAQFGANGILECTRCWRGIRDPCVSGDEIVRSRERSSQFVPTERLDDRVTQSLSSVSHRVAGTALLPSSDVGAIRL
jgi:hypothetical protein